MGLARAAPFYCFADGSLHTGLPPPSHSLTDPNGLLAAGGSLDLPVLLDAYRRGVFPWYSPGEPLLWWSPDPRTVFRPDAFHVSRSLARLLRRQPFGLTVDRDFSGVMRACGPERSGHSGTWITPEMSAAYTALHAAGHAHSIECWQAGELVGGVYGVTLGRAFFGESMFSRVANASKVALAVLCRHLVLWGYRMFDCQMESAHLLSLGAESIPRAQFLAELAAAVDHAPAPDAWRGLRQEWSA